MKVASRERAPGRTHEVAGRSYTFNAEPGTEGPNVCEVADPAALAIFLHDRNKNLFYAAEPVTTTLTRAPSGGMTEAEKAAAARAEELATVASKNANDVIEAIADFGADDLAALAAIESANGSRKTVLAAIEKRLKMLDGASEAETQARLILGNDEKTVLDILSSITDGAIIQAAAEIEGAEGQRKAVIDAIKTKLG